ncbi:restriction endonuclease subunit S [Aromatoleum anaerobium]|uniref:Restriction endonuclease subunit S n=1 Tax=Aromatoleum anaerobium TaxID=182180 RepID=A0ABX1PHT7_9RHOO|nr:restriction endonuclease subunit S [Aromatoleum anaerobium]MCK0507478.1 restriction endonuclease subunit S [Aromatoleum anaerobium]
MSGWQPCTLGQVVTLQRGFDITQAQQTDGKYPVVSSSGVKSYHREWQVRGPGVVIGRKGTLGSVFYLENNFWPHDTTLWVRDFHGNVPRFIFYYLKSLDLGVYDVGSSNPTLNRNHVHLLPASVPSPTEQEVIAAVLSSLDNKIDLLHRQNKTLEAMAETLFRQWLDEGSGEDAREGTLGDEFDFTMGQSPSGNSFNEDGIGVPMFQGNADFGFRFPKERIYTSEPTRFANPLDTLISVRAPVGAQNMAKTKCCIGRGVAAFRYKRDNSYYTYTYFKLRSLMSDIRQFDDEGTVFGSISKSDFHALSITISADGLVDKFESEAKQINDKVIFNCQQIDTLETLRDGLLPRLMSGEVRVAY